MREEMKMTVYRAMARTIPAATTSPPRAMEDAALAVIVAAGAVPDALEEPLAEAVGLRVVDMVTLAVG